MTIESIMDYRAALQYLYNLQRFGIKPGLQAISRLLAEIGNPHQKLNCIHVAGTNGKGSTCAMIEAILRNAGYRPGLYTSPHLSDFSERIQISRHPIPHRRVAELVRCIQRHCHKKSMPEITFFEFTTALAFLYFYEKKADPVIVETGLGGRLDATNVIRPLVSVITTISREHQQYLGKTINAIAFEKAGIIKEGVPVISGMRRREVNARYRKICQDLHAPLYCLGHEIRIRRETYPFFTYYGRAWALPHLRCGLAGVHQPQNAALAIAAGEVLSGTYHVDALHARTGIAHAAWPCRLEMLQSSPVVIVDGAHNPEACKVLRENLTVLFGRRRRIMVLGMMQDKDIAAMLNILTADAYATIVCKPDMLRSAVKAHFENHIVFSAKKRVWWQEDSGSALTHALQLAEPNDVICVAGSLFLAAEIRDLYQGKKNTVAGRVGM